MSNCEKQVKEVCDKLGFHAVMLGLINWVENRAEYNSEKIFTVEDEYLGSVLDKLREAQNTYVARYTCSA